MNLKEIIKNLLGLILKISFFGSIIVGLLLLGIYHITYLFLILIIVIIIQLYFLNMNLAIGKLYLQNMIKSINSCYDILNDILLIKKKEQKEKKKR